MQTSREIETRKTVPDPVYWGSQKIPTGEEDTIRRRETIRKRKKHPERLDKFIGVEQPQPKETRENQATRSSKLFREGIERSQVVAIVKVIHRK